MADKTDKNGAWNKERKRINRTALISVALAAMMIITFFAGYFVRGTVEPTTSQEMTAIMRLLKENSIYVSEQSAEELSPQILKMDELSAQFVQKVIAPYDPYAAYYSPQGYKQLLEEDRGRYSGVGIGLTFDKDTGSVKIAKVYLNSPAYKNGVKESDILVAGIKKDETEYTYFNTAVLEFNQDKPENERITALKLVNEFFAGFEIGDEINLKVLRNETEIDFTLKKQDYIVSYVEYRDNETYYYFSTEDDGYKGREPQSAAEKAAESIPYLDADTAYIKLYEFEGDAAKQFGQALEFMRTQGRTKLILDLRDNGGGLIDILLDIASYLINDNDAKDIRILNFKDKISESHYSTENKFYTGENRLTDISVIANTKTASASECLIGALIDYGDKETHNGAQFNTNRLILTEHNYAREYFCTYGKGIMQTTYGLPSGGALKLTTAKIFWPISKWVCVQDIGITTVPDNCVSDENAIARANAVLH
ncbi:MAG: hypothetical protein IJQ23_05365 [Clostridia bacterium]|nr:hypothetical protein [Clostridia bacterium]